MNPTRTLLACLAFSASTAHAASLSVPGLHGTIAEAVAAAAPSGDEIIVAPGDFTSEGTINLLGKDVDIIGSGPGLTFFPRFMVPSVSANEFRDATLPCGGEAIRVDGIYDGVTVLDNVAADGCNQVGSLVFVTGNLVVRDSSFTNITIEGAGMITGAYGDHELTNITVANVTSNAPVGCVAGPAQACSEGAGGFFLTSNLTVNDSTFDNCEADDGACLSVLAGRSFLASFGTVNIARTSFTNSVGVTAGAVSVRDFGMLTIADSVFADNTATAGSVLWIDSSESDLRANTTIERSFFTGNTTVGDGAAVSVSGFDFDFGANSGETLDLKNNWFCGNANLVGPSDLVVLEIDLPTVTNNVVALGEGSSAARFAATPAEFVHNTVVGHSGAGIVVSGGLGIGGFAIYNGIFADIGGVVFSDDGGQLFGAYLGRFATGAWSDGFNEALVNPDAVEVDPQFQNYTDRFTTTCADLNAWLAPSSLMRDAGDPTLDLNQDGFGDVDIDGSPPDIGAYGGPGAILPDVDEDGIYADLDCDDTLDTVYPGAQEVPYDGIDQNCDGALLNDVDGDGEDAMVVGGLDCDDNDPDIHTGATEVWYDGVDQDCDTADDFDQDQDGDPSDLFGGGDCDDLDPLIFSAATEIWYDGVDQNCNGDDDFDQDGDGFTSSAASGIDCDDTDPDVAPGADEIWYDGVDQDCDGRDDDQDSDGFGVDEDCDDLDATRNPDASDLTEDGIDQNCDGLDGAASSSSSTTGQGVDGEPKECGCSQVDGLSGSWLLWAIPMLAYRRRR